jgi:neopullulanase
MSYSSNNIKLSFRMGLILSLLLNIQVKVFSFSIDRIEPPFWWTGMVNPQLQIMVYGNDIGSLIPEINHPGVEISEVKTIANQNYLFININIKPDLPPGNFEIFFKQGKTTVATKIFELKQRNIGSAARRSFDENDAIYLIMPDRFSDGDTINDFVEGMLEQTDRTNPDGRHGGDINGIINYLDYIRDLGFTAIWCTPLIENNNPEKSYHGYAITDYYKIDPRFGTNKDYVRLVNECHKRDIKVIMDVVLNHCSIYSWLIKDLPETSWIHYHDEFTRSNFRASTITDPHASLYDRDNMLTGWFDTHMADLDQRNDLLANYLIQNTIWWIEFSGVDGLRLDTQPYGYKKFIANWAAAVFNEYPKFNIVGEAWLQQESITAYFQKDAENKDGYDSKIPSVTDFPLYYAINKAFNEKDGWTEGLASLYNVLTQDFLYSHPDKNLIFCDNHDLSRFYSNVGMNLRKWKMGIAFLLTTRGIPSIYYGTEILLTGDKSKGDGDIRKDFPGGWKGDVKNAFTSIGRTKEQNEAVTYLRTMLKWRLNNSAITQGKLKHFVPENETYVYFRYTDDECVMVSMNNSMNEIKALKTSRFAECMNGYKYAKNVVTGQSVKYLDTLTLPPKSVLVLELKK